MKCQKYLFAVTATCLSLQVFADQTSLGIGDTSASTSNKAQVISFPITRGGDLGYDVVFNYLTVGQTAQADIDYSPVSSVGIFRANTDSMSLPVILNPNTSVDPSVTFEMQIQGAVGVGPAPTFLSQQLFPTGQHPDATAYADLNGDGKPDLIVANLYDNTISIYVNTTLPGSSQATFSAAQSFATGVGPSAIIAADLNHDGLPDIAVANITDDSVSVFLNTTALGSATPTFTPAQSLATGVNPAGIAAADLNNDGSPDLVVTNYGDNTVSVMINSTPPGAQTATFLAQQILPVGHAPSAVTAQDFNNDGRIDLAVTNFADNSVSVLGNHTPTGSLSISFSPPLILSTGDAPMSVVAGDVNGDGLSDIVVANFNGTSVSIFTNASAPGAIDSTFASSQEFQVGTSPSSVNTLDINGDGKLDIAVVNFGDDSISVLENASQPGSPILRFLQQEIFPVGTNPIAIAAVDLNGDGRPDLVAANYNNDNTISILLNSTAPTGARFSVGPRQDVYLNNNSDANSVVVADINGDGIMDLLAADNFGGSVTVLLNETLPGDANLSFGQRQTFSFGQILSTVAVADVNGDGRPDVVVTDREENCVWVLLNTTPPGSSSVSFADPVSFATGAAPDSVAIADFNGDGKPDIVVNNPTTGGGGTTISVLVNSTASGALVPSFEAQQVIDVGDAGGRLAAADIDGDGRPDLLITNFSSDTVSLLLNRTSFGANMVAFSSALTFAVGPRPGSIAVSDLNGDGKLDLIIADVKDNTFSILLNNSSSPLNPSFAPQQIFSVTAGLTSPTSIAIADVDGDGKLDVVLTDAYSSAVDVLLNSTSVGSSIVSFLAPRVIDLTYSYEGWDADSIVISDLNRDGRPDFVAASPNHQQLVAWVNTQYQTVPFGGPGTGTIIHDYIFANGFE